MISTDVKVDFVGRIGERWAKRLESAQAKFQEIIRLEQRRARDKKASTRSEQNTLDTRRADGWLVSKMQSRMLPLFNGGNSVEGLEIRLVGTSVYFAGKVFSSNDHIEVASQRFTIKLLPLHYRHDGEEK